MKVWKDKFSGGIVCLFELVTGILLLVDPAGFTSGIITAFGVVLMVFGVGSVIGYFRAEAADAAKSQALVKGITALLAGGFCVFRSEWFVVTFPVLTLIYGIAVLIAGIAKLQRTVDAMRLKKQTWLLSALSAVISVACGWVIIASPFSSAAVLWMFTGISLIVEAVFDVFALIFVRNKTRKAAPGKDEVPDVEGEAVE